MNKSIKAMAKAAVQEQLKNEPYSKHKDNPAVVRILERTMEIRLEHVLGNEKWAK